MNSSFAISLANSSGLLKSGISYDIIGSGDSLQVRAKTILKSSGEEISYIIGMAEAKAEGWTKNPKYKIMPELMLRYRAATLLIRTHIPQVLNGMHMVDEIQDVQAASNSVKEVQEEIKVADTPADRLDYFLEQVEADEKQETLTIATSKADELKALVASKNVPDETVTKWCQAANVEKLEQLPEDKLVACVEWLKEKDERYVL